MGRWLAIGSIVGCLMGLGACDETQPDAVEDTAAGAAGQPEAAAGVGGHGDGDETGAGRAGSATDAGAAGEVGGAGNGAGGGGFIPPVSARDCNLDPLELDEERVRACLFAAECGLFAEPSELPMCLLAFNELSLPEHFRGPIAGTCALGSTTCEEINACLLDRTLPAAAGACAELDTTSCVDNVLTYCDGDGQRYESDCSERALACTTAFDDFDAQRPGCYPPGCVFYQERMKHTCEGDVVVASIQVEGASHANASEVRVWCPAFGYTGCGGGGCTR